MNLDVETFYKIMTAGDLSPLIECDMCFKVNEAQILDVRPKHVIESLTLNHMEIDNKLHIKEIPLSQLEKMNLAQLEREGFNINKAILCVCSK